MIIEKQSQLAKKKFYRKIAPLVKSILKIWLGAESPQVSVSFGCTLPDTPSSLRVTG